MIHIHTSQTSKNSCSIVISHPYYTSFTPTYIVVVVTVAVVTVITYIHITIVCPILFTNLSSLLALQSHIPTYIHTSLLLLLSQLLHTSILQLSAQSCSPIYHPYLHCNLTSLPTYIHCCCHCCHSCYTHTTVVVAHDAHDVCAEVCKFLLLLIDQ